MFNEIIRIHKNILKKRLLELDIDLKFEKAQLGIEGIEYFDVYHLESGEYFLLPIESDNYNSNIGFIISKLEQVKCVLANFKEKTPLGIRNNFFKRNEQSILNINKYYSFEFDSILKNKYLFQVEVYRLVTEQLLQHELLDKHLLVWIYCTGEHIKFLTNGKWGLLEVKINAMVYYKPIILGSNKQLWNVGDFCNLYYYKYNRMFNIDFKVFYNTEIIKYGQKEKILAPIPNLFTIKILE